MNNAGVRAVLGSLEVQLRVRKPNDEWPVDELVTLLKKRLAERSLEQSFAETIPRGSQLHNEQGYRRRALSRATNHDLLSYLILAGGELPKELLEREVPGSVEELDLLHDAFDIYTEEDQRNRNGVVEGKGLSFNERHELFTERLEAMPCLLESHPIATVRIVCSRSSRIPHPYLFSKLEALTERASDTVLRQPSNRCCCWPSLRKLSVRTTRLTP